MMSNFIKSVALLCVSTTLPLAALAQKTAPPPPMKWEKVPETRVTVDGSEAMFTTMCALLAAGYEANVSAEKWSPMRAQLRDRLQHQQGPAVEVLRNFYQQHELADPGAMLSRYIWFGLVSGAAPDFKPNLRRDELRARNRRDVQLLERAELLLARDVLRRQQRPDHRDERDENARHHVLPVVHRLVVPAADAHVDPRRGRARRRVLDIHGGGGAE